MASKQAIGIGAVFTPDQQHLRWSNFRLLGDPAELYRVVDIAAPPAN